MTSQRDQLRARTGEAFRRQAELERSLARGDGQSPRAGDLFVIALTGDWPVQWAVLGEASPASGELRLLPVDAGPLVGDADLEAAEAATGNRLVLRCGQAISCPLAALAGVHPTGRLASSVIDAARERARRAEAGELRASPASAEIEAATEYEDWLAEVVEPARAALRAAAAARAATASSRDRSSAVPEPSEPRTAAVTPFPPRARRPAAFGSPWAMAASVLLLVGLGFAGGVLWQQRDAGYPDDGVVGSSRGRVNANLPILPLAPERTMRGGDDAPLLLAPPGSRFALWLALGDAAAPGPYRLFVESEASGRRVLEHSDLLGQRLAGSVYLTLEIPANLLAPGTYRLRVRPSGDDQAPETLFRLGVGVP